MIRTLKIKYEKRKVIERMLPFITRMCLVLGMTKTKRIMILKVSFLVSVSNFFYLIFEGST